MKNIEQTVIAISNELAESNHTEIPASVIKEFIKQENLIDMSIEEIIDHIENSYCGHHDCLMDFIQHRHSYLIECVANQHSPFNDERVLNWDYIEQCYLDNHNYIEIDNYYFE